MVGTSQQVQAGFLVVFTGDLQGTQAQLQFTGEGGGVKALLQHVVAGQLVNHAGMQQQIARRPLRRAQQAQQSLVHQRAFQQQCQIIFTPEQGFNPVNQAHCSVFAHGPFAQPQGGALHQTAQSGA